MISIKIHKRYWLFENYYIFVMALYSFTLFLPGLRTGVLSGSLMLILYFLLVPNLKNYFRHMFFIDILVLSYIFYNLLTIFAVMAEGFPVSIFIKEFSNSILPIGFYFFGRCLNPSAILKFFKKSIYAITFCAAVGIFLYVMRYPSYLEYLSFYGYSDSRLSSFVGSIGLGSLSVTAVLLTGKRVIESNVKHGKCVFFFSVLSCVLSMQRSAWITCVCVLIVIHYYALKWKCLKFRYILLELLILSLAVFVLKDILYQIFMTWIKQHSFKDSGMFSSRSGQWADALRGINLFIGKGLGTVGHKAIQYSDFIVADGGFVKLICENGIIGGTIFIMIIMKSIKNGFLVIREYYAELGIVLAMLLQSIGSNIIAYQILLPLFWLSIGVLGDTKRWKKGMERNENYMYVSSAIPCDCRK